MVTRIKTIEYAFPALASLANNTLTTVGSIPISIPESGVVFKSVVAEVTLNDTVTATGGTFTKRLIALRLNASGYTTVDNTSTLTNSGESIWLLHTASFLSLFQNSWSGTEMTCTAQVHINQSTGTAPGGANVCVKLIITYWYEDTSSTHLKTVRIPFDSTLSGLLPTNSVYDTLPALTGLLPEAGVSIKNCFLQVEGNTQTNAGTTNFTLGGGIGNATFTGANIVNALASDMFFRYTWVASTGNVLAFESGSNQDFKLNCYPATGKINHPASTLHITYTFNPSGTTRVLNSLLLPMEIDSPMGGTAVTDAQMSKRVLWIQEPGPLIIRPSSFYLYWDQLAPIAGLSFKVSGQDYWTYTDTAAVVCGGNALQRTCDEVLSLSRGKNNLSASVYRTDSTDLGMSLGGYWIINYESNKHASGVGVHNSSIKYPLIEMGTITAATYGITSGVAPPTLSGSYFITAAGISSYSMSSTSSPQGMTIQCERLAVEGGPKWETAYSDINTSDSEIGIRYSFSQTRDIFKRYPDDYANRIDFFTNRRWRYVTAGGILQNWHLDSWYTIHQITCSLTGRVSGYTGDGSNISLDLYRYSDKEHLLSSSTSISGLFNITWYDDTSEVFITATEGNRAGRSLNSTP